MDKTKVVDTTGEELVPGHIYLFYFGQTKKGDEIKRLSIYRETTFRKMRKSDREHGCIRYMIEVEVIASTAKKPSSKPRPMLGYARTWILKNPPVPVDPTTLLLYVDMPHKYQGFDLLLQGDLSPMEVSHARTISNSHGSPLL